MSPVISILDYPKPKQVQTNADRIRAVSDEELADLMMGLVDLDDQINYCQNLPECDELLETEDGIPEHKCRDCLLKWLRQPAKEDSE